MSELCGLPSGQEWGWGFLRLDTWRVGSCTKPGMVAGKATCLLQLSVVGSPCNPLQPHLLLFFDAHSHLNLPAVPEHITLLFAFVLTFPSAWHYFHHVPCPLAPACLMPLIIKVKYCNITPPPPPTAALSLC